MEVEQQEAVQHARRREHVHHRHYFGGPQSELGAIAGCGAPVPARMCSATEIPAHPLVLLNIEHNAQVYSNMHAAAHAIAQAQLGPRS